jgi:hypothetical protein
MADPNRNLKFFMNAVAQFTQQMSAMTAQRDAVVMQRRQLKQQQQQFEEGMRLREESMTLQQEDLSLRRQQAEIKFFADQIKASREVRLSEAEEVRKQARETRAESEGKRATAKHEVWLEEQAALKDWEKSVIDRAVGDNADMKVYARQPEGAIKVDIDKLIARRQSIESGMSFNDAITAIALSNDLRSELPSGLEEGLRLGDKTKVLNELDKAIAKRQAFQNSVMDDFFLLRGSSGSSTGSLRRAKQIIEDEEKQAIAPAGPQQPAGDLTQPGATGIGGSLFQPESITVRSGSAPLTLDKQSVQAVINGDAAALRAFQSEAKDHPEKAAEWLNSLDSLVESGKIGASDKGDFIRALNAGGF